MKILVDSQETLDALATVCNAACSQGLRIAKTAIIVIEAASIMKADKQKPKEKVKDKVEK